MSSRKSFIAGCVLAVSLSLAGNISAGPLNPPLAPDSTYKTLDQVRPGTPLAAADLTTQLVITQPGVYYFTESIQYLGGGSNAIVVNTDNVVIDLQGFTFTGPGAVFAGNPLAIASTFSNVQVRNGTIESFPRAILLGSMGVVEDVTVRDGSLSGIVITGAGTVKSSMVTRYESPNGVRGIAVGASPGNRSLVEDCRVVGLRTTSALDAIGIAGDARTTVKGNLVEDISTESTANGSSVGIQVYDDSQVIGNVVRNIQATVLIVGQSRSAIGIHGEHSIIQDNLITGVSSISAGSYGIFGRDAVIRGNTIQGIRNVTSGVVVGIAASGDGAVTIIDNVIDKLDSTPTGVEIRGMDLTSPAIVRNNTVWVGTAATAPPAGEMIGIYARQQRAVITGNHVWVLNPNLNSKSIYFPTMNGYAGGNVTSLPIVSDNASNNITGTNPAPNEVF